MVLLHSSRSRSQPVNCTSAIDDKHNRPVVAVPVSCFSTHRCLHSIRRAAWRSALCLHITSLKLPAVYSRPRLQPNKWTNDRRPYARSNDYPRLVPAELATDRRATACQTLLAAFLAAPRQWYQARQARGSHILEHLGLRTAA